MDKTITVELSGYELGAIVNAFSLALAIMMGQRVASVELLEAFANIAEGNLGPEGAKALMHRLGDTAEREFAHIGTHMEIPRDDLRPTAPVVPTHNNPEGLVA